MTEPTIESVDMRFSQPADSCADDDDIQVLAVKTADAGDGPYLVISTDRWAIDADAASIVRFVAMLTKVAEAVGVTVKTPKGKS